jgi:hypothetical protein
MGLSLVPSAKSRKTVWKTTQFMGHWVDVTGGFCLKSLEK